MYKRMSRRAAAVALVVLAFAASSAVADTAEISPGGRISATSNGKITFQAGATVACNLTLTGTLATRLEVDEGVHAGEITAVGISSCEGGNLSAVLVLPWDIDINHAKGGDRPDNADLGDGARDRAGTRDGDGRRDGANGDILRDATQGDKVDYIRIGLDINGLAANFSIFGGFINCLYSGTSSVTLELVNNGGGNYDTGPIVYVEGVPIPFVRGSGSCPRTGEISGEFDITTQDIVLV